MLKHHFRFKDASFIRLPQFISPGPPYVLLGMAPGALWRRHRVCTCSSHISGGSSALEQGIWQHQKSHCLGSSRGSTIYYDVVLDILLNLLLNLPFRIFFIKTVVSVYGVGCMCHGTHRGSEQQLCGISSLLPPFLGLQGLNKDC